MAFRAHKKYDLSRLGKEPDVVLAKEWGITRERVRQFRKKLGIKKYNKYENVNDKIIEYLIKNKDNRIYISKLAKSLNIPLDLVNRQTILELANNNNISVKFFEGPDHGNYEYRRGCRCSICKLSKYIRFKLKWSTAICDYYAYHYIDLYNLDTSVGHKKFFQFIIENGATHATRNNRK